MMGKMNETIMFQNLLCISFKLPQQYPKLKSVPDQFDQLPFRKDRLWYHIL